MPQLQQLAPSASRRIPAIKLQPPGLPRWNSPTIKAQAGDLILAAVCLQVVDRATYPNGNVVLRCSNQIGGSSRSIYQSFFISADDDLICSPDFTAGDIITLGGEYVSFSASLPPQLRLVELCDLDHNSPGKGWDLYINGENSEETIWQDDDAARYKGILYRSAHQAAIVAAEMIANRVVIAEEDLPF